MKPREIHCSTIEQLPSLDELRALLESHGPVQFQVAGSREHDLQALAHAWQNTLPSWRVFCGQAGITIHRRIASHTIETNATAFAAAVSHFAATCDDLLKRLATHLQISPASIAKDLRFNLVASQQKGSFDDSWTYWFHGYQCRFESRAGQIIEANLSGFHKKQDYLDPWFFAQYLRTTPNESFLYTLFDDDYNDSQDVLVYLESHNLLLT